MAVVGNAEKKQWNATKCIGKMYRKHAHCTLTVKYVIKDTISTQNYMPNLSPINDTKF